MKDWLSQCVACIKRKSPVGRHHPLGNIPTGHRWDRIAMDILDVCDPTPEGFRYILVIADYFSKWTEAFPMKNKCADTVADILVENIILRFGMPLVIHSDQGREFENGLMKSLCALLGCTKTRTAHLLCYRYAIINNQKTFATGIRKWSRILVDFPIPKFKSNTETQQWLEILADIYTYLCNTDERIRSALVETGPRPFTLECRSP